MICQGIVQRRPASAGHRVGWYLAALLCLAASGEPPTRTSAAEPTYKGKTVKDWLGKLQDKAPTVRQEAAEALGLLGPDAADAVPALLQALEDDATAVREAALRSLGRIGPRAKAAVPALIEALADTDPGYRALAIRALAALGPDAKDAVPALLQLIEPRPRLEQPGSRPQVDHLSLDVLRAFQAIGPAARPAIPLLAQAMGYNQPPYDRIVPETLAAIGKEAVPVLVPLLKGRGGFLHGQAVRALQKIGDEAAPAMQEALKDKDPSVRAGAADVLGTLGPAARPALPALAACLKDEDGVRQAAARALGSLGPDSALFLIQALQDRNPAIRGQAAEGLAGVGRGSPTVLAALIKALKDRDEKVRQQAGLALYRVGPEVIVLLLEARKNKDNPEASALLQRMGTFFAPELIRLCKAKEEEARRGAAEVLVQVGTGTRMFMADVAQLLKEKDAAVRRRHRPGQARPGGPAPRRRPPDRSAEGQRRRGALPRGRGAAADGDNSQVSRPARRTAAKREEVFPMTRQPRDRPRTLLACGLAVLLAAAQAPTEPTFQGRPLSHWLKQLEAPEVGARRDAIAALAALGPDAAAAVPALLKALDDDDTQVRRGAITALGRIGPKARAAVPALTQALEDKNRDYRFLALRALAGIGPESGLGIPELMRAYQLAAPPSSGADLNYPQRVDICKLLGEQGAKAEKAVPLLVEALKDMQPGVRRAAADALEAIGPAAIPTVVKAFPLAADPQSGVAREEVLKLLKRFGPKAAKEAKGVIEALKSPEPAVRRAAVEFFASLGPAAVPVLAEALQRNDQTLREGALMGLASLGPDAIPELVKTLKDKDEKVRVASARALAQMGPKAKTAVAALAEALRDTPAVRLAAREALGSVGKEAVPFLVQALKDKDDVIRLLAVQGLGRLGPEAKTAIPALIEALKDRHRIVSDIAWNTLRQLGDEAVPSLLEALADKENPLAIRLLGTLRAKSAVPKLIKLLEDPDPRRRELAASTLGDIGAAAKEAQLALNKLLADKDRAVSAAAERALRTIGQAP